MVIRDMQIRDNESPLYIDIFAAKMWEAFAMQKLLTFFQQKLSR